MSGQFAQIRIDMGADGILVLPARAFLDFWPLIRMTLIWLDGQRCVALSVRNCHQPEAMR